MIGRHLLCGLLALCCGPAGLAADDIPPQARAAMDELWRRGLCVLSSIVVPARRASRVPRDLGSARALDGRMLSRRGAFACCAVQGDTLWAATDARLDQVDLASGQRVATFTPADGLPDSPIDQLVPDGESLWLVSRQGLGRLDVATGRIATEGLPAFRIARVAPSEAAVWVVADAGTFVLDRAGGRWRQAPPHPLAERIAERLDQGVWRVRWASATERMIEDAAVAGGKLYVLSMGTLAALDARPEADGRWQTVASDAWAMAPDGEALWVLTSQGVERHGPDGAKRYTPEDGLAAGRHRFVAVTDSAVWVATEGAAGGEDGGLSRFEKATRAWSHARSVGGVPLTHLTWLGLRGERLWAASLMFDKVATLSAHPGMMHVKRTVPEISGLALHHRAPGDDAWQTLRCPLPEGQPRYVLGQRGKVHSGRLVPAAVADLAPGQRSLVALCELRPRRYYGGYCHGIGSVAERPEADGTWTMGFRNASDQVGLQGEQPELLLVSESHGKRVVFAEGQPRALDVFVQADRVWAVTETAIAWRPDGGQQWRKVVANRSRFYWRATALTGDEEHLWAGGDAGTVSRIDRRGLRCTPVACLEGRKITSLGLDREGRLWVFSGPAKVVLPSGLEGLPRVEADGAMVYDGKSWHAATPDEQPRPAPPAPARYEWVCKGNFLCRRDRKSGETRRVAYLRGVFKPSVLRVAERERSLWLSVYEGILRLRLPDELWR
ncbi:MAG: hypothetical protein ACLF0G_08140 [Candidatus Brocadiia bacterium]